MKTATINLAALKAANCATSTERYYLNGVLVEVTRDNITYVATDGHILFAHHAKLQPDNENEPLVGTWIIPSDIIKNLKPNKRFPFATLEGDEFSIANRKLTINIPGGARIGFDTIDGCFPNWRVVVPRSADCRDENGDFAYNPYLLAKLWKAGEILDRGEKPSLTPNGGAPALVTYSDPDTFAVILPMRDGDRRDAPAWVHGNVEPVSIAQAA